MQADCVFSIRVFFQTLSILLNAKILAVGTCTNTVTATKECKGKWSVVVMGKNHVFGNVQYHA